MAERLVLYDSYFGNTAKVAKAIGEAIGAVVKKVDDVQPADFEGLQIFIIGSPTRA
ncbi:MAG: nitric oxide synthase, partial [Anaerolineaceae bacterium]|nr:nitric oxide synthase [Anaerolineaceae bacterium]